MTKVYKRNRTYAGWANRSVSLQECKKYDSLLFGCYTKLLHIQYNVKLSKYYQICWIQPIKINKKCYFQWNLSGKELKNIQNARFGKHF